MSAERLRGKIYVAAALDRFRAEQTDAVPETPSDAG